MDMQARIEEELRRLAERYTEHLEHTEYEGRLTRCPNCKMIWENSHISFFEDSIAGILLRCGYCGHIYIADIP